MADQMGPSPTPQAFAVETVNSDVGPLTHLWFRGPCGEWHVWLDQGAALSLSDRLKESAGKNPGLVIPPGGGTLFVPGS